jgi:hypothetical protein
MADVASDLFVWTTLFSRTTGLPCTIWVSIHGIVATDPCHPEKVEHRYAVLAWIDLNREALLAHWRGDIDGVEMALRSQRVP